MTPTRILGLNLITCILRPCGSQATRATPRWQVMDELLLAPEINPSLSTDAFLTDRHLFQASKSSEQEITERWHSPQILLVPMLKGLEARGGLIIDLATDWESAKVIQIP